MFEELVEYWTFIVFKQVIRFTDFFSTTKPYKPSNFQTLQTLQTFKLFKLFKLSNSSNS